MWKSDFNSWRKSYQLGVISILRFTKYPHNWQNLAPYADFRNNQYDLCCFSEVDNGKERYLITSVY